MESMDYDDAGDVSACSSSYSNGFSGQRSESNKPDYASEAMAADMDEWIIYNPLNADMSIDDWLQQYRPSSVSRADGIGWICVFSPQESDVEECDTKALQESWEQLKQSGRTLDLSSITAISQMHHVTAGKWMIFPHDSAGGKVDHLWSMVARATAAGMLGISAKVSPTDPSKYGNYVICIYNSDFTNAEEVFSLESAIRRIGIKSQLLYKPDCYTYLGIYRKNEWGIRPTLHESAFDIMKGTSVIKN